MHFCCAQHTFQHDRTIPFNTLRNHSALAWPYPVGLECSSISLSSRVTQPRFAKFIVCRRVACNLFDQLYELRKIIFLRPVDLRRQHPFRSHSPFSIEQQNTRKYTKDRASDRSQLQSTSITHLVAAIKI